MTVTTYYVTHKPLAYNLDAEAIALVDTINDEGFGNGDNRSWNTLRARVDASFDTDTQRRLGIAIETESREVEDD